VNVYLIGSEVKRKRGGKEGEVEICRRGSGRKRGEKKRGMTGHSPLDCNFWPVTREKGRR